MLAISDEQYNKLEPKHAFIVDRIISDYNYKNLTISRDGKRRQVMSVDIVKMFKEGFIFKTHIKETRDIPVIARAFEITDYYIEIRIAIRNLTFRAINLYYSNAIQFFDIQNILRFEKPKQEIILNKLLNKLTIDTPRPERTQFFHQFNNQKMKKLNTDKWKKPVKKTTPRKPYTRRKTKMKLELIKQEVDLGKPVQVYYSNVHPSPIHNVKELQSGRIKELTHKIDEMRKNMPTPTFKTADQLEKEYYDNLEIVIPEGSIVVEEDEN